MRNLFARELSKRTETDSRIFVIAGDLGYGVLDTFAKEHPNQYLNLGITEQATMSIAAGMAFKGFRPFVYSIANFPTFRCLEQIRNDVNSMGLPVTIVAVGSGLGYGKAGYSHFAVEDVSAMRALNNMRIYNPSNNIELTCSLESILASEGPAYLRIGGKIKEYEAVNSLPSPSKPDVYLVYSGDLSDLVLSAAEELRGRGIDNEVISLWDLSITKVDEFLQLKPECIVTIEEHVLAGGFSSLLLERMCDLRFHAKIERIGITNLDPHVVGSQDFLRSYYGITSQEIVRRALKLTGNN